MSRFEHILARFRRLRTSAPRALAAVLLALASLSSAAGAQQAPVLPEPVVAIHISELTLALEALPAAAPTPTGPGTTGTQWWTPAWRPFVAAESLQEALRSDGTPFTTVSDADIAAGRLRNGDGTPRYPIVISLSAEALADNEIAPLRDYVSSGGYLFANASSFTRRPDGTSRGDFALAAEMGIHMTTTGLMNWYDNRHFTKAGDDALTHHIPRGTLVWSGPLTAAEIPWGTTPAHPLHGTHYAWQVTAGDATVAASGDHGPLLTIKNFGKGQFIYHGAVQPIFCDATDPGMYSYVIFRRAIERAFTSFGLPLVKVSPWPYPYDAAFNARHDFENNTEHIRAIESSAAFDHAAGVKGDYYFSTGTLRSDMANDPGTVDALKRAVTVSGATIGSHNGGLKNPVDPSLAATAYDYWHWGPDEALDSAPSGYTSGTAYASASILASFQDIEGWLAGLDNGRPGCGAEGNCPRIWVSPYGNSAREDSLAVLDSLGAVTVAEQKIGVFPHRTISTSTPDKYYSPLTLPLSTWFIGSELAQAIDIDNGTQYYTVESIRAAVDFYHGLGAFINIYTHQPSNNGSIAQEYITYSMTKPRLWSTNAAGISDWWHRRSPVAAAPTVARDGDIRSATASITGSSDPDTAIEVLLPAGSTTMQLLFDNEPADPSAYRSTAYGVKVRVGSSVSTVTVRYTLQAANAAPTAGNDAYAATADTVLDQAAPGVLGNDTDAEGGALTAVLVSGPSHGTLALRSDGSFHYTPAAGFAGSDSFTYVANDGATSSSPATVTLIISPGSSGVLFSDDFARGTPAPWSTAAGTWTITNGALQGSSAPSTYAISWYNASWTDYSVAAQVQQPAGAFCGGIGGRVNASTGARYTAALYPDGSAGGSNVLKLVKFRDWTTWNYTPMAQVSLPPVGTRAHTVRLTFTGNRIQVSYDGAPMIDVTDTGYDGLPAFMQGGISTDLWTYTTSYPMTVGSVVVNASGGIVPSSPPSAQSDSYTVPAGAILTEAAPGVLANDSDPAGKPLSAELVSGASHGSVLLNADGSFSYTPAAGYSGSDGFSYRASNGSAASDPATVTVAVTAPPPTDTTLFTDDFTRSGPAPWTGVLGTWTVANGALQGTSDPWTYAIARYDASWTDYSVEAQVQFPAGAFGGGIAGRVNAASGARYTAAVYPEGSIGGSNVLKLVKFSDWTTWSYAPMAQVNLPAVGTGRHTLKLTFTGTRIRVSYDGAPLIDVTDTGYDGLPAFTQGGVSADLWTYTNPYHMTIDNIAVNGAAQ